MVNLNILKIQSCHNEALKRIQHRYKIETYGLEYSMRKKNIFGNGYHIKRQLPFKIESLEQLVKNQKERLLSLMYVGVEVEDKLDFKAKLTIAIDIKARN